MECGVEIATAEFPPSYHRGTFMQVTLAAVCLLSSIAAWLAGATFWWVVASLRISRQKAGQFLCGLDLLAEGEEFEPAVRF
jgi:hypothetical protein